METRSDQLQFEGHVGPRHVELRHALWAGMGLVGILLGLYLLLQKRDACIGPFFVLWGCLALSLAWLSCQRTLTWFEWTDDVLLYRRAYRATIVKVPVAEISKLEPLLRPRGRRPYGFAIVAGERRLNVEYDNQGNAMRLEEALRARLNCDGL
jgi:hypothetical protein